MFEGRQSAKIWFWSIHTHQAWSEFHWWVGSLLDVVDHEEIVVLLLLFNVRWRQWWLGADRLETDKWECTHQIWTIEAVLADAKDYGVTLELLFGEFQQRDERMLRCLVRHGRRQVHIKDVVQRVEDRFPDAVLLRSDEQLQRDLRWRRLVQHFLDDGGFMLVHELYGRLGVVIIGKLRRSGGCRIDRCLAIVFFQGRRPIVVRSGLWDIRTTTAVLQPTKHSRSRSLPTKRRRKRKKKSCAWWHDYYY